MSEIQPKALPTLRSFLANGMLLASLFPYLSPVPLSSDVQLLAAVLAVLTLFACWFIDKIPMKLTLVDLVLLFVALVYLVYVLPTEWQNPGDVLRKTTAVLLGFIIYLASRLGGSALSPRVVFFAAGFHLFAAALQDFAPTLHKAAIQPFLGQVRVAEDRGVGGACSEPSFLANIAILIPLCAWIVSSRAEKPLSKNQWILIWFCSLGMVGLSQAATAAVYGLVTLAVFGISRSVKSAAITTVALAAGLFGLIAGADSLPKSRVTELVQVAVKSPRLIIEDPSASMRLVGHYIAGPSLKEKPLGNGKIKLDQDYFWDIWNKYNLDSWYEVEVSRLSGQYYALGYGLTDVGANTLRMGWVFALIIAVWMACYRGTRFSPAVISFVFLGVFSSIPIVFPAYWVLLGLIQADRERSRRPEIVEPSLASS
jgi:hypothetical protein